MNSGISSEILLDKSEESFSSKAEKANGVSEKEYPVYYVFTIELSNPYWVF